MWSTVNKNWEKYYLQEIGNKYKFLIHTLMNEGKVYFRLALPAEVTTMFSKSLINRLSI